jgi:hypothetical protein
MLAPILLQRAQTSGSNLKVASGASFKLLAQQTFVVKPEQTARTYKTGKIRL